MGHIYTGYEIKYYIPGGGGVLIGHTDNYPHICFIRYGGLYFTWRFSSASIFELQVIISKVAVQDSTFESLI